MCYNWVILFCLVWEYIVFFRLYCCLMMIFMECLDFNKKGNVRNNLFDFYLQVINKKGDVIRGNY